MAMSSGVGRRGSDPALLWQGCGPALGWELPYAAHTAPTSKKILSEDDSYELRDAKTMTLMPQI